MRKFTIDRSKWICGDVEGRPKYGQGVDSELLTEEGSYCCLGMIAEQCRIPQKDLRTIPDPESIFSDNNKHVKKISFLVEKNWYGFYRNSELANRAITINDDEDLTQKERERKLKKLFKAHNIELEFVGKVKKNKHLKRDS